MRAIRLLFIYLLITAHGCTNNSEPITLVGKWVAQECIALNGIDAWVRTNYEFTENGSFNSSQTGYIDSDCIQEPPGFIGGPQIIVTLDPSTTISVSGIITFIELGAVQLQEGLNGGYVLFNIDIPPEFININAYYYKTENNLCFSNALIVNEKDIQFSKVASNDINFSNCLSREIP